MPAASDRFPPRLLASIEATRYLYVRAGDDHRFVPVWVVIVEGRPVLRSWNDRPDGWYRAFLRLRRGAIRVGRRIVRVRAVRVRGARIARAADDAYAGKYTTGANRPYVAGFATERRRATTLALAPA